MAYMIDIRVKHLPNGQFEAYSPQCPDKMFVRDDPADASIALQDHYRMAFEAENGFALHG